MDSKLKTLFHFVVIIIIQSYYLSHSKSIIKRLPGYPGDLPFKLETGYVGIGEKEDVQLFYYFVESTGNPAQDPLMFFIAGGPGTSGLGAFMYQNLGPVSIKWDNGLNNATLELNPYAWTQMLSIIFIDIPAGSGFSYAEIKKGWISSDSNLATQANEFIKKFLIDHPKFLRSPLYIAGISYIGIVVPKITLELYEGNERGDQPTLNIQGYILFNPLTHKFKDFNSRFEYAHRMALISDDIYKSAIANCQGNYINVHSANLVCANSLQSYEECIGHINLDNILEPFCDESDPAQDCDDDLLKALTIWANTAVVQEALGIRQGTIEKWEWQNSTIHYKQGKNNTFCYSYDIFSSYFYHKKLVDKKCQVLIISGDHDMTFPYVGVEQWITSLDLVVDIPWKPFFVDGQVGGYEIKYARNDYSLSFATVKGAGHVVPSCNPKETVVLMQNWFSTKTYSSGC